MRQRAEHLLTWDRRAERLERICLDLASRAAPGGRRLPEPRPNVA